GGVGASKVDRVLQVLSEVGFFERHQVPQVGLHCGDLRPPLEAGQLRNRDHGQEADDRDHRHQLDESEPGALHVCAGVQTARRKGPESRSRRVAPERRLEALVGRNQPCFGGVNVGMTPSLGTQPAGNAGVDARSAARSGTFLLGGDLPVHRLGFGAMRLTGKGIWGEPRDVREAIAVLRRAVELGVNLIDTADSYGPEVSERIIAEALYPYPPGLVIATKAGLERPGPDRWKPNGRPEHLRAACEGSLRRLKLERIDLYQLHRIDPEVPFAWLLRRSPVMLPIPGTSSVKHLEENVAAALLELSTGDFEEIAHAS